MLRAVCSCRQAPATCNRGSRVPLRAEIFLTRICPEGAMQARSLLLFPGLKKNATTSHREIHASRRHDSVLFADEWRRETVSHGEACLAAGPHRLEAFHPRPRRDGASRAGRSLDRTGHSLAWHVQLPVAPESAPLGATAR